MSASDNNSMSVIICLISRILPALLDAMTSWCIVLVRSSRVETGATRLYRECLLFVLCERRRTQPVSTAGNIILPGGYLLRGLCCRVCICKIPHQTWHPGSLPAPYSPVT